MKHRLTKIYTKTGDQGLTSLGDGSRVSKLDPRVEAYGTVDELNSCIGLIAATDLPTPQKQQLVHIQHKLFDLGSELCVPGRPTLDASLALSLEQQMDQMNEALAPLKEFILPGGSETVARTHLARTVCRRAERRVLALQQNEEVNQASLIFLNRLSDWLFVFARYLTKLQQGSEINWQKNLEL